MGPATSLRRPLALALLAVALAGSACGSSSDSGGSSTDVKAEDFSFSPEQTSVKVGQTVTWTNDGQTQHTVKGPGFFSSKALGHGEKFSHEFTRPGHFAYLCTLHPTQMRGTVIVQG